MEVINEDKVKHIDQDGIEIRLSEVVYFFKINRWKILLGGVAGLVIGILYAWSLPNVYTVQVNVMPEFRGKGGGGLNSLTSDLLGLGSDMSSSNEPSIRPDLYPNVLQSVPFALNILKQAVYSKKLNAKVSLQDYINKIGEPGLLDNLLAPFRRQNDDNIEDKLGLKRANLAIEITKEQDGLIKAVLGSVTSIYDKKTGILSIKATELEPIVAATVAQLSLNYLTNYITAYRTDKARSRVDFLKKQVQEVKLRYQNAEYALSNYRDRNRSLYLNTAKLDEQRLQADYLLEQSVYNDLAKQLEQAKIKVEEETPTFKMLDPPIVPLHKSGPKRTFIMIGFAVIGIIVSIIIIFARRMISGRRLV
ncbi:GNVR domain-containing protein [Spirosoma validum]|uniref:Lipopolysaccharide biosynthesis protein n=1 Tax=Spirosoma validum TaxID=2771355 RepID=A0A927AY78_9BACT|nr:GNVR domain-containing protein [Spirosoma validum]MBD2751872.1 lipopolysaccharide biosynthesis protein [Spirosoma validum]